MKRYLIIILTLISTTSISFTQTTTDTTGLYLEFPLFDIPYQIHASKTTGNFFFGYANPSMNLALAMSNNLYGSAHWGITKIITTKSEFKNILFCNLIAVGFDLLTFYTPLGMGWLHEEYHRAVMTRRGINSFNDMNCFPVGKSLVYVRKVTDENLIMLSDYYKQDFRRLMIAGNEGQFHQIQTLQKNNFYLNQDLPNIALYWMSSMINIGYLNKSGSDAFNKTIDESNKQDGADIGKRDFTGADFTAWADALFYPDKPYSDRGIHPSGVGINRYIKPSQLSSEARSYLRKQGHLHWLNLLSPHLVGFPKIKLKSTEKGNYYGNFAIRHLLTPFGNDIALDVFYQTPEYNFFFALHNYNNLHKSFFGLECAIIDQAFLQNKLLISGRTMLWIQPKEQAFLAKKASFGGMLGFRASYGIKCWYPYIAVEGKTGGWLMGNPFLEKNISMNMGISLRIK
ncbi:MAG TPA: hypothetical protein PLF32_04295 [Bacteroidales bacterium]|nr:hypothetical protein [Bacteroidales bacterium]HOR81853.1 hypothetical protein [Bacteroidales bacterium]HPJ92259.1 hypothetical protein [Bacteroidales bacterium]